MNDETNYNEHFWKYVWIKKNDKNTKKLYKCHSTDAIFECSHNALRCDAHIYLHNQF